MGQADVMLRRYMSDPARFADAFNYVAYGGEQLIDPNELRPLSTVSVHASKKGGKHAEERRRDGLMTWQLMRDGKAAYALLGVEDQTYVDYAMPARCMLYDALSYMDQVDDLKRKNRKSGDLSQSEWLCGLRKTDKLLPVATLVVHFGTDVWDSPLSLDDMLKPADERLMALVPEYHLNLLTPSSLDADDLSRFHTELGLVLGYIRYAQNKDDLAAYVSGEGRFRSVEAETAELVNALTDSRLEYDPGEERVDMCKAIEDMRAEALDQGMREGMREGIREGIREGMRKGSLKALSDLVGDGVLPLEDAAARAGMAPDEFLARTSAL